jgi:ligand-binding sensor domain-containing protein
MAGTNKFFRAKRCVRAELSLKVLRSMIVTFRIQVCAVGLLISTFLGCHQEQQYKISVPAREIGGAAESLEPSTPPKQITRNIIQDRKGNIWMASWQGVFRYDGKAFTNVTASESSARFFSLLEDRGGNLWFGSIGGGVYRYDGYSFRNFTVKEGLLNNEVVSIHEDKSGYIWFGVNGGMSRYDGRSFKNYVIGGDTIVEDRTGKWLPDVRPPNEVNAIIEDRSGKYWFATRRNTFVFDGKAFTAFRYNGHAFQNVRTLIEDRNGNIWFGGNDGLWRYDGTAFKNLSKDFGGFIYEDRSGNIWTSSEISSPSGLTGILKGNGPAWALSRYEKKSLFDSAPAVTRITSGEGMIFGILEANDGSIWFGTTSGVRRYDGNAVMNFE